jgi:hypothetical protein
MEDNQKELKDALISIHKEQTQVKADIAALKILKQNPEAHNLSVNLRFNTSAVANAS